MIRAQEIWIIGAGRHGRRAADALGHKNPKTDITIIDNNAAACAQIENLSCTVVQEEGVTCLLENLKEGRGPDWIIPMIPVHVAYEWIRLKLAQSHRTNPVEVPTEVLKRLPNPVKGSDDQIYISNADFRCPWNCPEPDEICTFTGKSRPLILHRFLEKMQHQRFRSVVVHSRQLLPGIGGYTPAALFQALRTIASGKDPVLLSTACQCHGVIHAFEIHAY